MPIYEYGCLTCDHYFEVSMRLKEYDDLKGKQTCPACSSGDVQRRITTCNFNLKGENGFTSKAGRINTYMRKRQERLAKRQFERKREVPVASLAPNFAGEQTDTWADAQRLAKDRAPQMEKELGVQIDPSTYEPMIRKEKEKTS